MHTAGAGSPVPRVCGGAGRAQVDRAGGCRLGPQCPVPSCGWGLGVLWTLCWEMAAVGGRPAQAIWPGGGGGWQGVCSQQDCGVSGTEEPPPLPPARWSFCSGASQPLQEVYLPAAVP